MMGGLLYERRSSEASLKIPSSSTKIPTKCATFIPSSLTSSIAPEEEEEPEYEYSKQKVSLANNRYEYVETPSSCIGHGSFGIVFKGIKKGSGEEVAVKKMSRLNVKQDELKTMQRVQNSFLVALIDICDEFDASVYLIMELCDTDLDKHLKWNTGSLSTQDFR